MRTRGAFNTKNYKWDEIPVLSYTCNRFKIALTIFTKRVKSFENHGPPRREKINEPRQFRWLFRVFNTVYVEETRLITRDFFNEFHPRYTEGLRYWYIVDSYMYQ